MTVLAGGGGGKDLQGRHLSAKPFSVAPSSGLAQEPHKHNIKINILEVKYLI